MTGLPVPQRLVLQSQLRELSRLAQAVNDFGVAASMSSEDRDAWQLALEEIVTNAIAHGYRGEPQHEISVTLETLGVGKVRAVISDRAPAYNPLARPPVDTSLPLEDRPLGGLGVHLVRQLMDVCTYEYRDGQNWLTLERASRNTNGSAPRLTLSASRVETLATFTLKGRLDGLSSGDLESRVESLLQAGVRTLVFDLAELEYVSSAGLRVFLLAAKRLRAKGGEARFVHPTPTVAELFGLTGLLGVLAVTPTPPSTASASARRPT